MIKVFVALFLLCLVPYQSGSQIFPKEGASLNYRIIGFSFPIEPLANEYKIEISAGNFDKADSFVKHIILSTNTKNTRIIEEVPAFGSQYTWRFICLHKKERKSSELFHFRTLSNAHADTTKLHLRIIQPAAAQYKDDYVSVDAGGVLYDMSGNPVWFIPDTNGIGGNVGALNFTPEGTITFLFGKKNCEINYNADILWQTPKKGTINGDTTNGELYHHEFIKRPNGHYVALGTQMLMCKPVVTKDTSYFIVSEDKDKARKNGYRVGKFGTLIEYDEHKNIVWSWKSIDYLKGSDFDYFRGADSNVRFDPHANAFFFDEKNKCIYLGFRNLNRIIVIDYPSGKVLRTYGETFKPGMPETGAGLFCNQHSIGRTQDGYLYVFNNNSCNLTDSLPTVIMLQEPVSAGGRLKKIWEYTCTANEYFPPYTPKTFGSGGNAVELPDQSIFVCMGSNYGKTFIVDRNKKVYWSALPERFMETDEKWVPVHEYRANIITRKDLERLIWSAENIR